RNGRMFILVDDEDRENEGDLVIPAQMATPDAINFMVRHGRGLVCLALTKDRSEQLGLEPMTRTNRSRMESAFTVSIEARDGISTGISAADRARTVAVAIDASNGPDAIASPGNGFPLIRRPARHVLSASRLPADRPARRRARPRRPHRSGGRRLAPRRAQPERRDLRDHARGRNHGPARGSARLRPDPLAQDRAEM